MNGSYVLSGSPRRSTNIKFTDKHYFSGKYQEAMLLVDLDKLNEAESVLKKIIGSSVEYEDLPHEEHREKVIDFAHIALGRIYYEMERLDIRDGGGAEIGNFLTPVFVTFLFRFRLKYLSDT